MELPLSRTNLMRVGTQPQVREWRCNETIFCCHCTSNFQKIHRPCITTNPQLFSGSTQWLKICKCQPAKISIFLQKNTEIFEKVSKNVGVNAPLKIYRLGYSPLSQIQLAIKILKQIHVIDNIWPFLASCFAKWGCELNLKILN